MKKTTLTIALMGDSIAALATEAHTGYSSIGLGRNSVTLDGGDFNTSASPSPSSTADASTKNTNAYNLILGYQFNRYAAVELSYWDFGAPSYGYTSNGGNANSNLKITGTGLATVVKAQMNPQIAVLAGVGTFLYDAKRDNYQSWGGSPGRASKSGAVTQLTLGAEYAVSKRQG
ncbi:outer membrane beta-barrel protein [Curvibacter sp. CHRR-16]|uniref:outer membrane beta-barrel protein n=1 Tax=Curvibacter sp. CHRR-16 TaxID=2835872 RepID=UPI001BDA0B98|nr:outer membrane beta-barrel protein [Curvibacter sp. CHRR-16]MBT0569908.1 outer membrane beta-barrel protein [Curvibacter sp. CHRR-16]